MYGLSRQASPFSNFLEGPYLPDNTLICSIGENTNIETSQTFVEAINTSLYEKIVYIHAVGVYPFELDSRGAIAVSHDKDGDGIDDRVVELSYKAFFAMSEALRKTNKVTYALIFGGLADKHRPAVHTSWWTVMERIRNTMRINVAAYSNSTYFILNISSVICAHELLTRPFVFRHTNANPRFWLAPHEVAQKVSELVLSTHKNKLVEEDLFHPSDYYHKSYFKDEHFTGRKIAELGIKKN